jgi:hypothetical protein
VIVIGDPATNAGVAPVDATEGLTVKDARCSTSTLTNVASSDSSVTLKASNAARRKLLIVNDSTATLYVKFGSSASITSYTRQLQAGETMEETMYTGVVDGIWASATGSARVTELTV